MSSVRIPLDYRYGFLILVFLGLLVGAAVRCQSHRPRRALEHASAEISLELPDLVTDGRGRDRELFRGPLEAGPPGHRLECTQRQQGGKPGSSHAESISSLP
jgi:hypothetical protein